MIKRQPFPFHSILLSIYPILFLLSHNLRFVQIDTAFRSLIVSVGITIFFLLSFRIILSDWQKAGAICTVINILFFSFGHIFNSVSNWFLIQEFSLEPSHLSWSWLSIFLVFVFIIVKFNFPPILTRYMNIISIILIILPIGSIIFFKIQVPEFGISNQNAYADLRGENQAEKDLPVLKKTQKPDIYYIILDSYERADKLNEYYGIDNDEFIQALENKGFYILSESRSNYLNTSYSLNTSLNLVYIHDLPRKAFINSLSNLRNNHVSEFLQNQGYQIVVFQSGTGDTDKQYSDIFIAPPKNQASNHTSINSFEQFLLKTTLGLILIPDNTSEDISEVKSNAMITSINQDLEIRRERITHAFDHLPDYTTDPGNFYLFAHIYLPHIPFLYGPDMEPLQFQDNLNAYWYEPKPENYNEYYGYQIEYLNHWILTTIDQILTKTKKPVVILIQADHGDGNYLRPEKLTPIGVDTRSAILNAIYFSDQDYSNLYPSMTPVNSFRVILNKWFGTQYPLLEDKVYANEHPSDFSPNRKPTIWDGCLEFNICLPEIQAK